MHRTISVLVVLLSLASSLVAQTSSGGSIVGVVKDEQGALVAGAAIGAASASAPGVHRTTTDDQGRYRFLDLPPAEYTLTAEHKGFATVVRTPVSVRAGVAVSVDFEMKVGGIGETVEVRTESPLLDTRNGTQAVNVSGELLREVPLSEGREWYGALVVTPGVVTSEFAGTKQFFVRGAEPSMTLVQLDGVDVTNAARSGVTYLQLNADAVEDIQIQTGGVRASSPLGTGGVINVVTASGTNRLKGAGTLFVQPRQWNDSNQPGGTSTSVEQTQVDVSAGGPLLKDHLWAFGSLRRADATIGVSRTAAQLEILNALVDGFEPIDTTREATFWLAKVTAQAGRHQITGFYQRDENPVFDILSNAQHAFGQSTGGASGSARIASVWTNRFLTTLTAAFNDKDREGIATDVQGPTVRVFDRTIASGGRLAGNGQLASLGAPVLSQLTQPNQKLTVAFDATLFASHGRWSHEVQMGIYGERRIQGNHLDYTNDGFTIEEQVLRQSGVYTSGLVPFHRTMMLGPEITTFNQRGRDFAGYVQDTWRPSSRMTISAGLRADRIVVEDTVFGITSQRSLELGPRFGINYMLSSDGRNVARGYWARIHDQPGIVTTTGTPGVGQRDFYDVNLDGTFETEFLTPPTTGTIANRTIDPDLHQPYVQEWGAGYSRQFSGGMTAGIDVARRRFTHRPTLVETNQRFDGRVFAGYENESFNDIFMATNNRWNTPVYSSLELSLTRRTPRVQAIASYARQWRHIDGTWQPHDPASFIQPDAFDNNRTIGSATGTASAASDANSLNGFHMTQSVTASAQWQDHVARTAITVSAPWALTLSANYTFQSGVWSGPIVTRIDAADPAFGPPTIRLSNGRVVSNPLATLIRFAHPTRGDGQLRTPAMHNLNIRAGRRFKAHRFTFDASIDVFNVTNNGSDLGFEFGANQLFNPLYGVTVDRQAPRSAQLVLRVAF